MGALSYTLLESEEELSCFDCGNASINELVSKSYYPSILKQIRVYKISVRTYRIGFCSISVSHLSFDNSDAPIADYYTNFSSYGALKIDFLAVDKRVQKQGIGTEVLKYFVGEARKFYEIVPIRVLIIDALREKIDWYSERGFALVNSEEENSESPTVKMFIDLMSAEDKNRLDKYIENAM